MRKIKPKKVSNKTKLIFNISQGTRHKAKSAKSLWGVGAHFTFGPFCSGLGIEQSV